ncbi:MAG: hypothetical protein ABSA92_10065 [Candidatus Bathyarchaeia archaeon]
MDAVTVVNFVLAAVIFILGVSLFGRKKSSLALYIGIAFGLFAISHLVTLLGLAESLAIPLIAVRMLAYLIVIFALFTLWKK